MVVCISYMCYLDVLVVCTICMYFLYTVAVNQNSINRDFWLNRSIPVEQIRYKRFIYKLLLIIGTRFRLIGTFGEG